LSTDRTDDTVPDPSPAPPVGRSRAPDPRYVVLGAISAAERQLRSAVPGAIATAHHIARPVATTAGAVIPSPVRRALLAAAAELDGRGRAEAEGLADAAGRVGTRLADEVSRHPLVLRIVEELQWRVVDDVLPVVLERLADDPDSVRSIVQGQSLSMIDDVTTTARSRVVAADDAVDRLIARLLRRAPGQGGRATVSPPPNGRDPTS
jgi:hypothetical protein